jgi:hypothetical protein
MQAVNKGVNEKSIFNRVNKQFFRRIFTLNLDPEFRILT